MGDYKQNAAVRLWQRFTEMYGSRFLEAYGAKPTDSWVDVMGDLSPAQVKGALAKIRNGGSPHPPSLPEFLALAKCVQNSIPKPEQPSPDVALMSGIALYGNRALMAFLQSKGACSESSMRLLLETKNRLCRAYEEICEEEPDACKELRDKLLKAFEDVWQPITEQEASALRPGAAKSRKKIYQPETKTSAIQEMAGYDWRA